jgi:hypothetical protein
VNPTVIYATLVLAAAIVITLTAYAWRDYRGATRQPIRHWHQRPKLRR